MRVDILALFLIFGESMQPFTIKYTSYKFLVGTL